MYKRGCDVQRRLCGAVTFGSHYLEIGLLLELLREPGEKGGADIQMVVGEAFWFSLKLEKAI